MAWRPNIFFFEWIVTLGYNNESDSFWDFREILEMAKRQKKEKKTKQTRTGFFSPDHLLWKEKKKFIEKNLKKKTKKSSEKKLREPLSSWWWWIRQNIKIFAINVIAGEMRFKKKLLFYLQANCRQKLVFLFFPYALPRIVGDFGWCCRFIVLSRQSDSPKKKEKFPLQPSNLNNRHLICLPFCHLLPLMD